MRSQWKRSEKFDTGSCHFERILKARPHIRDVIQSKLVWNSKAKALLFCPKFVYSVVSLNVGSRAVKPEPKRTEKGVTFLSLPAKNKKLPKKFKRLRRDERFIPKKLKNVNVCNEHFTDDCLKLNTDLSLWVETQEVGHWKMLSDNFSMEGSCKGTHC